MAVKKRTSRKLAGRKRSYVRKSSAKKKRKIGRFSFLPLWGKRIAAISVVIALICRGGAWFFLSDADIKSVNWANSTALSLSSGAGFKVDKIFE